MNPWYPQPQQPPRRRLSKVSPAAAVVVLVVFALVLGVFAFGWWFPNVRMWQTCGANNLFSMLRGLFEKPDVMTCWALNRE